MGHGLTGVSKSTASGILKCVPKAAKIAYDAWDLNDVDGDSVVYRLLDPPGAARKAMRRAWGALAAVQARLDEHAALGGAGEYENVAVTFLRYTVEATRPLPAVLNFPRAEMKRKIEKWRAAIADLEDLSGAFDDLPMSIMNQNHRPSWRMLANELRAGEQRTDDEVTARLAKIWPRAPALREVLARADSYLQKMQTDPRARAPAFYRRSVEIVARGNAEGRARSVFLRSLASSLHGLRGEFLVVSPTSELVVIVDGATSALFENESNPESVAQIIKTILKKR